MCSKISDVLLQEKGHYIQAINYPTVPIGQEKLRLAPTPHHTTEMIDTLIEDLLDVWVKLDIPMKAVRYVYIYLIILILYYLLSICSFII